MNPSHTYKPVYRLKALAAFSLGVAVIIILGLLIHIHKSAKSDDSMYKFTYKNLVKDKLAGDVAGDGLIFMRPPTLQRVAPDNLNYISYYAQNALQPGNTNTIAAETILSSRKPDGYDDALNSGLQSPSATAAYRNAMTPVQSFITDTTGYLYFLSAKPAVTLDKPSQIFTSGYPNGAWVIPFSSKVDKVELPTDVKSVKGEIVVAPGKTNYYYLMISTVEGNWKPNQAIWSSIVTDAQIDK